MYRSLPRKAMMVFEYALKRRGPLTMAPSQLGIFTRSSSDFTTPNLQFHVQPVSLDKFGDEPHPFPRLSQDLAARSSSRSAIMRSVTTVSLATATMISLATATMVSLATDITAARVSVSARSASGGNPQTSCNDSTLDPPG
jgi:choline dehydrogenase